MKRLILLVAISFALCVNVFGQIHKALGDKPLFSHYYTFESNNDSVAEEKAIYTYNAIKQLTKSITFPFITDEKSVFDSIVRTYDANDRVISSTSYRNEKPYYSEEWIYDITKQEINYYCNDYTDAGVIDSLFHISYKGVRDFDNAPGFISEFSLESLSGLSNLAIDCDTVFLEMFNSTTSSSPWKNLAILCPAYQNRKIDSAKMIMENLDLSLLFPDLGTIVADLSIDYKYAYNGDKLMTIKGDLTVKVTIMGFPVSIPLTDAIVATNQYDNNDSLIESTTEINIDIDVPIPQLPPIAFYNGIKQKYTYNADNNISVMTLEERGNNTASWTLSGKTYYFYNEDNVEDIVLINTEDLTQPDIVGEAINIKVLLENKNYLNVYQDVKITALIEDMQGTQIAQFTDTIDQIERGISMLYTFSQDYIVPTVPTYNITVFIDSYDNDRSNDTLYLTRHTTPLNDIKTIDNSTVHISQNFPNPANNQTLITYSIPAAGQATFSVYSINGQLLSSQSVEANTGENTLVLNTDKLAAGIYFYAFEFNGQRIVRKMNISR